MWRQIVARFYYMWGSLHRNFGNRSSFQREHRAAIRRFTQAYDFDPGLREARLDRGIILYREMGQLEQALGDFDALLAEDPAYGPALLNRALVYQDMGRFPESLSDLEAYLALPDQDEEYRRIARRTVELVRDLIAEIDSLSARRQD